MNENNVILENNALFLEIDQAVPELTERPRQYGDREVLMVVLSQSAMPVASKIARFLKLNLTFSPGENVTNQFPIETIKFDFKMVKESGRDMPQDFMFHEQRN